MNIRFSLKLAWSGMRKNGKLYLPYLLTCIGMVAMGYILQSISVCSLLEHMKGGGNVAMALSLGKFVVAVFASIFLLYSNSFLLRRRKKEFGLYHILGMGKRGIRRIIFWENLTNAFIGLLGGLLVGVIFSKFAELILANILRQPADSSFTLKWVAFRWTLIVYGCVFLLLMVYSLIAVQRMKTLELFQSERLGEKPPKANLLIALIGVILLGVAYGMAVAIKSPLSALLYFFVAVILVIIATYLLFIAGSVVFCRLLQKNKKYYYKKQHFVSVSSMVYRMRRNGAGLASICILSTMVLVMLSSTGSLYFGMEDTINGRYPREVNLGIYTPDLASLSEENQNASYTAFARVAGEHGLEMTDIVEYPFATLVALFRGEEVLLKTDSVDADDMGVMENLREMMFVEAADYNRMTGEDVHPKGNEAYVLPLRCSFEQEELPIDSISLTIKGILTKTFPISDNISVSVVPALIVVVEDLDMLSSLENMVNQFEYPILNTAWCFSYNLPDATQEQILSIYGEQKSILLDMDHFQQPDGGFSYYASCKTAEKEDFVSTFGGLFFLGIILSLIFVVATVLIIYYKQISEGYEDRSRFEIMQKVGMTREDIRKNINSQILTVFIAPLVMAGLHLAFAYPMIWKILQMLFMNNLTFVILVTVGIYLVFGICYASVYKLTAGAYYAIVSGDNA
ncbi:MAG: FtsX-like permease family protein [Acetatifactor sp.]